MKLTIKAANGQADDFQIDAPLNWTILELKHQLFRQYPSKPVVISQKLICSGKLLLDEMTISQLVSTSSSGQAAAPRDEPLVIHLVAYDYTFSSTLTSTTSHPTFSSSASTSSSSFTTQDTAFPPRSSGSGLQQEQLGNPWLRYRGGVAPVNVQNFMPGGGGYPYPMAPPSQFYMSPYGAAYANQLQQWYNDFYRSREPRTGDGGDVDGGGDGVRGGGGGGGRHPLDLPINQNMPNNLPDANNQDDVDVNAPGGVGMMGGGGGMGGGLRQRDFVDYVYMFMMISFLVLVAYLTGSLGRLLIFTIGVLFMLLNQGGFFFIQRRRVPDNIQPPAPPQEERRGPQDQVDGHHDERLQEAEHPPQEAAANAREPPPSRHQDAPPLEVVPERPGFLATIMVFVITFFTSLVPQQRPELAAN